MSDKSHDPNQMTGAAMIVRALIDHGVKHIFGYPGCALVPIYDEIFQQSEVEHILVRHEQGAGHAAEGYARSTGKPGVVLVTSGPGATNMVTPLTDALMDSIPLVCITGQVPTHLIGNDAFQECDTVGITRPCTKHNWLVRDVNDLAKVLHEAFYVASTGRPGPVVVDVPKDVQFAVGTYHPPRKSDVHVSYAPRVKGDATQIRKAVALLASAKRPVIYTGGGIINSGNEACKLLRELVEATGCRSILPQQLFSRDNGFACAGQRARRIAEIVLILIALHVAHAGVGVDDLALQLRSVRLLRQIIQVAERVFDHLRADRCGTGHTIEGIRIVEHDGMGQLPEFVEAPFRSTPRQCHFNQTADQRTEQEHGDQNHGEIATDESGGEI